MKKLKLSVLAIAFGLLLAITGTAFTPASSDTIYWFESNEDGSVIGAYLPGGPTCSEITGDYCALGFTEEDLENVEEPALSPEAAAAPLANSDDQARKL